MRVSGETISSDDTYSGSKVIKLLEASFNNGKAAGWVEASTKSESELQKKYQEGFNDGKIAAEQEYRDVIAALSTLRDYLLREDE
jgi:hypothetical protein